MGNFIRRLGRSAFFQGFASVFNPIALLFDEDEDYRDSFERLKDKYPVMRQNEFDPHKSYMETLAEGFQFTMDSIARSMGTYEYKTKTTPSTRPQQHSTPKHT